MHMKLRKSAVHQAVSVTDNYYPYDVGLWIPADIFAIADLSDTRQAELAADIYSTLDQVEPDTLPPAQREKFARRRMEVGQTLRDHTLSETAYAELEAMNSTAGYFLKAREYAPSLNSDQAEITSSDDLDKAKRAAAFLTDHFDAITNDDRCLWLLLENLWLAELGRRPLHGERAPLPVGESLTRLLTVLRALNLAAGASARHGTRYLEAVLTWVAGGYPEARDLFGELGRENRLCLPRQDHKTSHRLQPRWHPDFLHRPNRRSHCTHRSSQTDSRARVRPNNIAT